MDVIKKCVRYADFPDTTNGCIGFKQYKDDPKAVFPWIPIKKKKDSGIAYVQIDSPEKMDEIAIQVGAQTREEFIDEHGEPWKDKYSNYLSGKIGVYLEGSEERGEGLLVHVYNEEKKIDQWLELSYPPREFVIWTNRRYKR
ncbi:hypothetical protein [Neobacillus sp. SAB-20_R2A]|uniref:hypothetical protein n=1 Tax=Neobacillus sp. SAB-20_R2A TaxID=3120519 RepID=UPI003C6DCF35